ncbi:MAG TPA: glycosyltransferase family 1 protein [Bacteroidota bacterium]|nr:glycosyltransferase family 1 protein [Bacteroidota bacterium]
MPLIGIDARKYHDFGIGTYIQHLLSEFISLPAAPDFHLFLGPQDAETVAVPERWKTSVSAHGKYSVGEFAFFGREINSRGVSLFHSPHYTLPFGLKCPSVVTIHDLIHLRFPRDFSLLQRSYSYGMMLHATSSAEFIITDSEFTKLDILRSFRVSEDKIIPIHLGVSEQFSRSSSSTEFREKFRLDRPYVLFVGNTKPHKGIDVLLRAFNEVTASYPDLGLVFVGSDPKSNAAFSAIIDSLHLSRRIASLGWLSNEDLNRAYQGAEMFVLPSFYEGFGLPVLEAMACGTPVIASDAGSLPEIAGDAAILCETGKYRMFADAMVNVLRDHHLKNTLIRNGIERASRFSWKETARRTLEVYHRAM